MADVEMKPAGEIASGTAASGARPASATSTISVDSDEVMEVDQEVTNKGKKKPRRKVVIDYDCVNSVCKVSGRGGVKNRGKVQTATNWAVSYYGAEVAPNKKRKICPECGDRATEAQARMLEDLLEGRPVVDHDLPKKRDLVDLGDSDDEEVAVTDTSSEESDRLEVELSGEEEEGEGEEGSDGLMTAESLIQAAINSLGIDEQVEAGIKNIKDRLDACEASYKEVDDEYDKVERDLDSLRMELYAQFRPELKQTEPLIIEEPPPRVVASQGTSPAAHNTMRPPHSVPGLVNKTPGAPPPAATPPPDLPEAGKLDRPELKKGDKVLAVTGDMLNEWLEGTIQEVVVGGAEVPELQKSYKVRIPRFNNAGVCITATHKTTGPRNIAYHSPAPVRLQVGTRVIGLYKEAEAGPGSLSGFYSGIIAEPPKTMNKFRYLVFFDDGYASYIPHKDIRAVTQQTETTVWMDIHPNSREFIKKYLMQYPERPMVRLQQGQVVQTEWEGAWWYTKVEEVDASLVKLKFHVNNRQESIYRGSTRLLPLYNEMQQQKKRTEGNKSFSRHNRGHASANRPIVEYTRQMSHDPGDPNAPKRAVARKSTGANARNQGDAASNQVHTIQWAHKGHAKEVKPEGCVEGVPFVKHTCGSSGCTWKEPKYQYVEKDMKGVNPLLIPVKLGWKREFVMFNNRGRRRVYYIAPCGRRLRSYEEVHRYLRVTHSTLEIDFFNFDWFISVYKEWSPDRKLVEVPDMSYGKESVPVSCVNSLDNNYSEYIEYSTKRLPQKDVHINLDDGFLTCCDCQDDCQDKEKCACWQLTIQHTNATSENKIDTSVGYEFRRLKTCVQTGIFECNHLCKCKSTCLNRVAQHPLRLKLQVFKTEKRGWGIRTLCDIPAGSFICVYVGNLYTNEEGNKQGVEAGDEYFAELDMIETIERAKEGYESDVEDDEDLDDIEVLEEEQQSTIGKMISKKATSGGGAAVAGSAAGAAGDSSAEDDDSQGDGDEGDEFSLAAAVADAKADPDDPEFRAGAAPTGDDTDRCTRSRQKILDKVTKKSKSAEQPPSSDSEVSTPQREVRGFNAQVKAPPAKPKFASPSKPKFTSTRKFFGKDDDVYIMDAKCIGNIGRYLNHSCRPNVMVQNCFVDTHDVRFPWVAFFSKWKISAGEELNWDYNYIVDQVPGKEIYCECGAENCRGRLL